MKKYFVMAALAVSTLTASAQSVVPKWINNVKLSGFGIVQYTYNGQENNESNSFNLRLARLALDGRAFDDWYWKAQIQFIGNTSTLGSSPKLVDLFIEWQKYDFLRVKAGQFKNPFTYENPMHPIDQGFMSYSQVISKFAGFSDRAGAHSSNGRDIGVQLQGDFLKNASGRNLIHYQVGVFNGQGINVKDVDHQKNIIGGAWVMPVEGMRLGAFGWIGSYARKGTSRSPATATSRRVSMRSSSRQSSRRSVTPKLATTCTSPRREPRSSARSMRSDWTTISTRTSVSRASMPISTTAPWQIPTIP